MEVDRVEVDRVEVDRVEVDRVEVEPQTALELEHTSYLLVSVFL